MKKKWNKKNLCLAAAAFTLVAGVSVGGTMAYFTTYTVASGGAEIKLGNTTIIPDEEVVNMEKRIAVTNTGDMECFVRVKVFAGDKYQPGLKFTPDAEGTWSQGDDGYYYCSQIIPAGGTSNTFNVKIDDMDSEDDFNIIVVQECTAVLYDENGKAVYFTTKITAESANTNVTKKSSCDVNADGVVDLLDITYCQKFYRMGEKSID